MLTGYRLVDEAQELLRDRQKRIQSDYSGSQIQQQLRSDRMPRPTVFRGYDADSGLAIVQPLGGELVQGRSVTNGAIATDATVVSRQAGQSLRIDSMPSSTTGLETPSRPRFHSAIFAVSRLEADNRGRVRYTHWLKFGNQTAVKIYAGDWVGNFGAIEDKGFQVSLGGFHLADRQRAIALLRGSYAGPYFDPTELLIVQVYQNGQKSFEWQYTYTPEDADETGYIPFTYPPELSRYLPFLPTYNTVFIDEDGQRKGVAPAYLNAGYNMSVLSNKNPKTETEIYQLRSETVAAGGVYLPFSTLFSSNVYELYKIRITANGERENRVRQLRYRSTPAEFEMDIDDVLLHPTDRQTLGDVIREKDPRGLLTFGELGELLQTSYTCWQPKGTKL